MNISSRPGSAPRSECAPRRGACLLVRRDTMRRRHSTDRRRGDSASTTGMEAHQEILGERRAARLWEQPLARLRSPPPAARDREASRQRSRSRSPIPVTEEDRRVAGEGERSLNRRSKRPRWLRTRELSARATEIVGGGRDAARRAEARRNRAVAAGRDLGGNLDGMRESKGRPTRVGAQYGGRLHAWRRRIRSPHQSCSHVHWEIDVRGAAGPESGVDVHMGKWTNGTNRCQRRSSVGTPQSGSCSFVPTDRNAWCASIAKSTVSPDTCRWPGSRSISTRWRKSSAGLSQAAASSRQVALRASSSSDRVEAYPPGRSAGARQRVRERGRIGSEAVLRKRQKNPDARRSRARCRSLEHLETPGS